ncbi:MAG: fibrobacter succinogenes major paralogous domain-containing protein [Bacteroidales bacterium]
MKKVEQSFYSLLSSLFLLLIIVGCNKEEVIEERLPTVTTSEVRAITIYTAMSGGEVVDDGGRSVDRRGVCWSTQENPTINGNKSENGSGKGSFISSIIGLEAGTTYFLRAYAVNSAGVGYGNSVQFTTLPEPEKNAPTVTTIEATEITATSAKSGGDITDDGGSTVVSRGVCWGLESNPTIEDNKSNDGSGMGLFSSTIEELTANTTYYYRAYATNSIGTGYGEQLLFTSDRVKVPPSVETVQVVAFSETTATIKSNVITEGAAAVTERGVCWSSNENPTIEDSKISTGSGIGVYESVITGLEECTLYYVRAYATSIDGTSYGDPLIFQTSGNCTGTFIDPRDNTEYKTVKIGGKIWMAENLRYLPTVVGPTTGSTTEPYFYVYGYDGNSVEEAKATENWITYGTLYNWSAAMNGDPSSNESPSGVRGICPEGWHLPSDAEWDQLSIFLGGSAVAGGKLKENGTTYWNSPNSGATNETGFSALPGGYRTGANIFNTIRNNGHWWSSSENSATNKAWYRGMYYSNTELRRNEYIKEVGWSVRCIKN